MNEMYISICSPENYLTPEQINAVYNMNACRTIEKGGRIAECPECHTQTVLYNPCNQRGCPKCYEKNQIQWANKLKAKLLPISHYHLTVSLPEQLTYTWLMDKTNFINSFFHAVQQGFKQLNKDTGLTLGIILVFQSHGVGLCYKLHMHCIVTSHGLNSEGKWVPCGSLKFNTVRDCVKDIFIPHLRKKLPAVKRSIAKYQFALCKDREYKVFPAVHKFNGERIVDYLAKSTSGVAVNIKDVERDIEANTMTITEYHNGKKRVTVLDRPTFRDRYLNHIPPKGAVTIRSYGLYSNRQKEKLEEIRKNELGIPPEIHEEEDDCERCSECNTSMTIIHTFSPGEELPLKMRLFIQKNESPPEHGSSLHIA